MKTKKKMNTAVKAILIILGVAAVIVAAGAIGSLSVANKYLDKIEKVTPEEIETIPPEEEDFETDYFCEEITDPDPVTTEISDLVSDPSAADETDDGSVIYTYPAETMRPEDVKWQNVKDLANDSNIVNIILVGQDRRPGEKRARSDSMILCSINTKTGKVSLISFLRDLYVQIPGYSDNRLNVAFAFGGFPLMYEAFYKNFGIKISGGFWVDFDAFKEIIDILGGVDITLTAAEANWIAPDKLKEGVNHLDGKYALAYSRIRKLDSDFGRTSRQRTVLTAIYSKFRNSDLNTLMELLDKVLPYMATDMSNTDILSLAAKVLPKLTSIELSTHTVPANDAYKSAIIRGMMVLVPDLNKINNDLMTEYLPLS